MSEKEKEENQIQENELSQKLSQEEIAKLVKEAKQNEIERKFFLEISLFSNYCHPNRAYVEDIEILEGEVKIVSEYKREDQCNSTEDLLIVPLSKVVVLKVSGRGGNPQDEGDEYHIFLAHKGWVTVS